MTVKSLKGVILENEPAPHEYLYWLLGRGKNAQWAVRTGKWKLLGNPRDVRAPGSIKKGTQRFLVDLDKDQSETKNVAELNPQIVGKA